MSRTDGKPDALYVTDSEIIRRLGIGEKTARVAIRELERRSGFPKKDPLLGDKRYWPAVKAFFDRRSGVTVPSGGFTIPAQTIAIDGEENPPNGPTTNRRGARHRLAPAR